MTDTRPRGFRHNSDGDWVSVWYEGDPLYTRQDGQWVQVGAIDTRLRIRWDEPWTAEQIEEARQRVAAEEAWGMFLDTLDQNRSRRDPFDTPREEEDELEEVLV